MLKYLLLAVFLFTVTGCGDVTMTIVEQPKTIRMVGNSMFAWNDHGIRKELDELYNWRGGDTVITDAAFVGATAEMIQRQWFQTKGGDIDVAIMDGGANNVFINAWWCWDLRKGEPSDKCKEVVDGAVKVLEETLNDMQEGGVRHAVFIVPYHVRGPAAGFNNALDYAILRLPSVCKKPWCSLVELSNFITPDDDSLYFLDGVHPSSKGSRRIARVIYNTLNIGEQLSLDNN